MIAKMMVIAVVAAVMVFMISVLATAEPPETTDEWAGFDGDDFVVGALRTPTATYTPTPTLTPFPTLTPVPTPTPTATVTPYPTPTSKMHLKPEYVATAERVLYDEKLQVEIYGRELDSDEIDDILKGINSWYSMDFLLRCMVEIRMETGRFHNIFSSNGDGIEWEYPPATEKARLRFPDAVLVKDSSGIYFLVETLGPGYTPVGWYRRIRNDRRIETIYFDTVENTHVRTEAIVDFETCEPLHIERIKMGVKKKLPTRHIVHRQSRNARSARTA